MDYEELSTRVNAGEEFLILYKNTEYWISQNKDGYYFSRDDGYSTSFNSVKDLLEYSEMKDGVLFKNIINGLNRSMVYMEDEKDI